MTHTVYNSTYVSAVSLIRAKWLRKRKFGKARNSLGQRIKRSAPFPAKPGFIEQTKDLVLNGDRTENYWSNYV